MAEQFATVDDYIASFPQHVRGILEQVRRTIHEAAPKGVGERISYGIPAVTLNGQRLSRARGRQRFPTGHPTVPVRQRDAEVPAERARALSPHHACGRASRGRETLIRFGPYQPVLIEGFIAKAGLDFSPP